LLLFASTTFAQVTVQDWKCENQGGYGSFWWKVERSENKLVDGFYYYYIYVQSNSYLNDLYGSPIPATTYIQGVTITMLDNIKAYQYDMKLDYLLFDWKKYYAAYFYHTNPYKKFGISYYAVYPYSYSSIGKY